MVKEVEMSVRDTIDLDAALAQFIKDKYCGDPKHTSDGNAKEESK